MGSENITTQDNKDEIGPNYNNICDVDDGDACEI